jgi:acetolactate synthase-1/2/3 large subunit
LAAGAGRADLIALVKQFGLGVYTAFRRQDAFPNSHPNYLGHLTLGTSPELVGPLAEADVVLTLGGSTPRRRRSGYRGRRPK